MKSMKDRCAEAKKECNIIDCPYVEEQYVDEQGCERCRCMDPCKTKSCPDGSLCTITLVLTQDGIEYRGVCQAILKPGYCPTVINITECEQECITDTDCVGELKCCDSDCGRFCMEPMLEKLLTTTLSQYDGIPAMIQQHEEPRINAQEGTNVTLKCIADGDPKPTITWRKERTLIRFSDARRRILHDGSLHITNLYSNDSGIYLCAANNDLGPSIGAEYILNVTGCACENTESNCCLDDKTSAKGPNINESDESVCQYTKFGCCPDNSTAARGPNNEGCGCQYTPHGCCPNRFTPASGPNFDGCPCHTYQFGCCPDGITIAKGASGQGCGCENTEFKCCLDEKTPAKGPNFAGCTCDVSQFGCCPDGVEEAKGENFEDCLSVPSMPGAACELAKDRGTCRDFTIKWYYDTEYGGCSRFWYGGCKGNENRFKTQEECKDVCVQPKGKAACFLPKIAGPCQGYHPTWYYDADRKQCGQFVYGGCLGNANKFKTREECEELCVTPDGIDPCEQPKETGPCAGNFTRWHFNAKSQNCEQFVYGGCKANGNNFPTEIACHQQCLQPGRRRDVCNLPVDSGPCRGAFPKYYYEPGLLSCIEFNYGGCDGNANRFSTISECESVCKHHEEPVAPGHDIGVSICKEPVDIGSCSSGSIKRFYYDEELQICRAFIYTGCGGNRNRFKTFESCMYTCRRILKPGRCPKVSNSTRCEQECATDADCDGELKCCDNGCGTSCLEPVLEDSLITMSRHIMLPQYDSLPATIQQPEESRVSAQEGGYVTLKCVALGVPIPTITWRKDTTLIGLSESRRRILHDGSLQITNLYFYDRGTYVCTADNGLGPPVRAEYQLNVTEPHTLPLSIIGEPDARITVMLNSSVSLHCDVVGWPRAYITWWHEDKLLPLFSDNYEQNIDYSLLIRSVTLNNLGVYTCQAYNGKSKATSWTVTLQAIGPVYNIRPEQQEYTKYLVQPPRKPITTEKPQYPYNGMIKPAPWSVTLQEDGPVYKIKPEQSFVLPVKVNVMVGQSQIREGSEINIKCSVDGYPTPRVFWYKDNKLIQMNDHIKISELNRLIISHANQEDSGQYQCKAVNEYTSDTDSVDIHVSDIFIHPSCTDNRFFATCDLIVRAKYCFHEYYKKYCCKSCTEAGLLPVTGPHLDDWKRRRRSIMQSDERKNTEDTKDRCAEAKEECNVIECPYVEEQYVDKQGCKRCRCMDPCETKTCPDDARCIITVVVTQNNTEYRGVCQPILKPGQCPTVTNITRCDEQCTTDADCVGELKCCENDCGTFCLEPTLEQPLTTTLQYDGVPAMIQQPEEPHINAQGGTKVTLRCITDGDPEPTISWRKDSTLIRFFDARRYILHDGSLHITNLYSNDSGIYLCAADNGIGPPVGVEYILNVTGCICENTGSNCCSDEKTSARDPNIDVNTCDMSQFGCCADGVEEAQGENFESCLSVPSMPGAACGLTKDQGPCKDFTLKWYYDSYYGGCSNFWYGGCRGNENRFKTVEECNEVCVQPKGKAACFLPKVAGPCKEGHPTWYYDADKKECGLFIYGGCLGNANKFKTKKECEELCITRDGIDPCKQPKEIGPCAGNFTRWYFNAELQNCEQFAYGGCKPNNNNFLAEIVCHHQCLQQDRKKVFKPGHCPKVSNSTRCEQECAIDADCVGKLKCCDNGCGTSCLEPSSKEFLTINPSQYIGSPVRIQQLEEFHVNAQEGGNVTLKCVAVGDPKPTITWRKDTTLIGPSETRHRILNDGSLQITNLYTHDKGTYVCTADNGLGPAAKAEYQLNITVPVKVNVTVGQSQFPEGSEIRIGCSVDGYPIPRVLWYKNDKLIRTNDHIKITELNSLIMNNAIREDSGQYRCEAVNEYTSDTGSVDIHVAVPVKVNVTVGQSQFPESSEISISCRVDGYPTPRVSWYKDNKLIQTNDHIKISELNGLIINNAKREDSGQYRCEAVNEYTSDTGSVDIHVAVPVKVNVTVGQSQFPESSEISIGCRVDGYPTPRVSWYKDNKLIQTNDHIKISELNRLIINNTKREDSGQYRCEAVNEYTSDSDSVDIRVVVPVKVNVTVGQSQFPEGSEISIGCSVDGFPTPRVLWYKNDTLIRNNDHIKISDLNRLFMNNASREDSGRYRCEAVNEYTSDSDSVDIRVVVPVKVNVTVGQSQFPKGSEISIGCRVDGYPTPRVSWYKDNKFIQTNEHIKISEQNRLIINNAKREDSGQYRCEAVNEYTSDSGNVDIRVAVPVKVKVTVGQSQISEGSEISINCSVDGYPTPRVSWYKDDKLIQTNDHIKMSELNRLIINKAKREDSGQYRCEAVNEYTSDSDSVDIRVVVPVKVNVTVGQSQFPNGNEISIGCRVDGYPTPRVSWYKDNKLIQTNDHIKISELNGLIINNAKHEDSGQYRCEAVNEYTSDSGNVDIRVAVPVKVKVTVGQSQISEGSEISINCSVDGYPTPRVSWYKDDKLIQTNDHIKMSELNRLIINKAKREDSGQYRCEAVNEYDSVFATVNIHVAVPVKVKVTVGQSQIREGSEINIICSVDGYPTPRVSWYKDNKLIQTTDHIRISELNQLIINKAKREDSGQYRCVAVNEYTSDSGNVDIHVALPVKVKVTVGQSQFPESSEINIGCKVDGYPTPRVTWYKDNKLIQTNNHIKISVLSGLSRLIISNAKRGDSGRYQCNAVNEYTSDSGSVGIDVVVPVKVKVTAGKSQLTEGDDIKIGCSVDGYPAPRVTWYKDNKLIQTNDHITISGQKLVIDEAERGDAGQYQCKASNKHSSDSDSVTIRVDVYRDPNCIDFKFHPRRCRRIVERRRCFVRRFQIFCCRSCTDAGQM